MRKNNMGILAGCFAFCFSLVLHADQVNMLNGERYVGKVITFSNEMVVVQSDFLGTLTVPRSKIASIALGTNAVAMPVQTPVAAAQPAKTPPASATANPDLATAIQQLRANTNVTRQVQQQVQQQFLSGADPKATEKFNQMINGLVDGSIGVEEIRAQAKSAADQLRAAKKDLGDDSGLAIDGYLAVLDGFLRETDTPSNSVTNFSKSIAKPKHNSSSEDE